jgi:D-alanine-D-alanine ligase
MDIGIAFDLRSDFPADPDGPEDRLEEYDKETTIDSIQKALERNGHRVRRLGGGRRFIESVLAQRPELVFNISEGVGTRSREAHVPAVCEMLGIPFTHSDPLTLAVCLDKPLTKRVIASFGIATPEFAVVEKIDDLRSGTETYRNIEAMRLPLFVKPACEGSSMGVRNTSRVESFAALEHEVARCLRDYREPVLVEAFLPGTEYTVGVVGNRNSRVDIIGVMEIAPRRGSTGSFVYGLETKRDFDNQVVYHCPPSGPQALTQMVEHVARSAFIALGCRDVARFDIRVDRDGRPSFLEVNPLPGLSPESSDIVILAREMGWTYESFIDRVVTEARVRYGL